MHDDLFCPLCFGKEESWRDFCKTTRCAWFDAKNGRCAMVSIARNLEAMADAEGERAAREFTSESVRIWSEGAKDL